MASRPTPCPRCARPLVEIQLSAELGMRSCSTCEERWWHQGDERAPLGDVLEAVGALTGRRRAS
jgi:hypothetical protein